MTRREAAARVVFRKWHNGQIIALFPDIPASVIGPYCQSYEHIGQHGAADYSGVVSRTTAAKPDEYRDLLAELKRIGYELRIVQRASMKH